ncbi:MAG: NAD(+)/NADH kinase [Gemmatimonadota bacterium]|nr:NAD(+)/NADH kinase [Gemmatimonadota bacterium]
MKVGLVGNLQYPGLAGVLARVVGSPHGHDLEFTVEESLRALWPVPVAALDPAQPPELILTLGGDGTLLRAAREFGILQVPIMGVNLGRVGFLTTATPADLEAVLAAILAREFRVEPRKTLETVITNSAGQSEILPVALNDVVFHKEGVARLVRLRVSLGGQEVGVYSADGLIVTTPTGSTAYSLSAGGPIVVPGVESFVITPVCAHTLGVRPLVISSAEQILIEPLPPGSAHLMVSVDGQRATPLDPEGRALVRRGPYDVPLAWLSEVRYFHRMRTILGWGDIGERESPT